MTSSTSKFVLSIVAGAIGAMALVPQFSAYAPALTFFAGVLLGGAHIPRPGDANVQSSG